MHRERAGHLERDLMSPPRILLIGQAAQDYIASLPALPREPIKYRVDSLTIIGGGLGANAAVAAARLGGQVELITRLGDDSVGIEIRTELARDGVDTSRSRCFSGRRSPISLIAVDANGERMILNYSDPAMPDGTDWLPSRLPKDTAAVMGDIRWESGALHLVRLARQSGVPAVIDADRALARSALLKEATHVAFSAQALREQTNCADLAMGLRTVQRDTSAWLAVTDGSRGIWFTEGERIVHIGAFGVRTVETLAAGDTFHGALTLALGEKMAERDAVRFASAAAAVKCTRLGGRSGIPDRRVVEQFLNEAA
jgi:sulfofructose kinase